MPLLTDKLKVDKSFDNTKFPNATFKSTSVTSGANGETTITGNLTLNGVTKSVVLHAHLVDTGVNPLENQYTVGFETQSVIKRTDFGVSCMRRPARAKVRAY